MKKTIFLLLISTGLFASSEGYVPFSDFSNNQKLEYNFEKVDKIESFKKVYKKVEKIKEIKVPEVTKRIVEKDITKDIDTIKKVIKEETPKIKIEKKELPKKEIVKPISVKKIQKTIITNTPKIDIKKSTPKVSLKNKIKKSKEDLTLSLEVVYSPLSVSYSKASTNESNKSNSFEPKAELSYGKHKASAKYFKSENSFSTTNLETTWYKLGYKYNYKNANIGIDANHLVVEQNSNEKKESFPSLEVDFKNSVENIDLSYGASLGKNDNVDSYEYFVNVGIKPISTDNTSLLVGYKNRTVKIEESDEKLEFKGPFIGVNTSF